MEAFAYYYLLAFGFLLLGVEALIFTFYILWIGFGFIIVGFLSPLIEFNDGMTQIAVALVIGFILLLLFKEPLKRTMNKKQVNNEFHVHTQGTGTVFDGSIKMDGTFWQTEDDLSSFSNGDKVDVIIKEGKAHLVP